MWHSAEIQVNQILLLIIERLRKILAHQCYIQSEHVSAYAFLFPISVYSTCLYLANKATLGSDINLAFRPDDNHRLIVHEYSGLELGDAHGLRAVREFINNRTDLNRAPAERLHAIW